MEINQLVKLVKEHRCYNHPIFSNWSKAAPSTETIGALFHHIRCFCDSTRPGWNLPQGLASIGLSTESHLLQEIVDSEEDHGPELAMMAGNILNKSELGAGRTPLFLDLADQYHIEASLKGYSDMLLSSLPGYDKETGLMPQTLNAIHVFERRKSVETKDIYVSLGSTLALEMISNKHLIPGEKQCLIDSELYNVSINDEPMHYLLEHYGETGAESMHEQNAIDAVGAILNEENSILVKQGALEFLDNLASLWDMLDSTLLSNRLTKAA